MNSKKKKKKNDKSALASLITKFMLFFHYLSTLQIFLNAGKTKKAKISYLRIKYAICGER